MIGVQGTFYFGEKGTKTFGVDRRGGGSPGSISSGWGMR